MLKIDFCDQRIGHESVRCDNGYDGMKTNERDQSMIQGNSLQEMAAMDLIFQDRFCGITA